MLIESYENLKSLYALGKLHGAPVFNQFLA